MEGDSVQEVEAAGDDSAASEDVGTGSSGIALSEFPPACDDGPPAKRRLVINISVSIIINELSDTVTDLRKQLMAAMKREAARPVRKSIGSEEVVQRAVEWQQQAEDNAAARTRLNGA
eukprot:6192917-Pleurochrysis_carterae.AAC.2